MVAIARPAPFILKPLAGLYNPYAPGCSLLCNHPTNIDAREIIKQAKDNMINEHNYMIPVSESSPKPDVELNIGGEHLTPTNIYIPQVESVPEELFRRYTDTDSRPQTPAPTLISGMTRLSTSRRCVTPDPQPSCPVKERTKLILDLRRSHSQENLSIYGSSPFYSDPPLIRIEHSTSSCASFQETKTTGSHNTGTTFNKQGKRPGSDKKGEHANNSQNITGDVKDQDAEECDDDDDEQFVKRRGKKRRRKPRDSSRGPTTFQPSADPETQVATIGPDSHNPSARHSLAPEGCSPRELIEEDTKKIKSSYKSSASLDIDSFLTKDILKQLRRELDEIVVDTELNSRRRKALEEALKTVVKGKPACDELASLQKQLKVPSVNADLWIALPRTFTRSSAIFQLPMDSRTFSTMTPLEYVMENVKISSSRKLLYNCIFEKYKLELDEENGYNRGLDSKSLRPCLDLVMGKPMTEEQYLYFKNLVKWQDESIFGFKECCGIFALCERIMAPQFSPKLLDRTDDPCHEIETVDFSQLEEKLEDNEVSENLKTILYSIKNF